MALNTNANLLTALAAYSIKTNETAHWPDHVLLAETDLNARIAQAYRDGVLITPQMQTSTATISDDRSSVPADFLAPIAFELLSDPKRRLQYVRPEELARMREREDEIELEQEQEFDSDPAPPKYYTIVATGEAEEFDYFPDPETSYTASLTYLKRIDPIATASDNWLLTRHPGCYLYGALVQYGVKTLDERLPLWREEYERAVAAMLAAFPRETQKSRLRTDVPLRG